MMIITVETSEFIIMNLLQIFNTRTALKLWTMMLIRCLYLTSFSLLLVLLWCGDFVFYRSSILKCRYSSEVSIRLLVYH